MPGLPQVEFVKSSDVPKAEEAWDKPKELGFQEIMSEVVKNDGESRKAYRARLMEKLKAV